jgi:hypothetical protein
MTGGMGPLQPPLDLVWKHLLPALGRAALPDSPAELGALRDTLANLRLPPVEGDATTPIAAAIAGRTFTAADGTRISLQSDAGRTVLALRDALGDHRIVCGYEEWTDAVASLRGKGPEPIAASGAWTAPDTFTARIWFTATPYCQTLAAHFAGDTVTLTRKQNVAFGPTELPTVTGRRG